MLIYEEKYEFFFFMCVAGYPYPFILICVTLCFLAKFDLKQPLF